MPITAAPQQGHGQSITFSSGFFAWILSCSGNIFAREVLDTTNSATTQTKTNRPAVIGNAGTINVEIQFNASTTPPITGSAETITWTFPLPQGASTAPTWAASGYLSSFNITSQNGAIMTASATLQLTGPVTITAAT